MRPLPRRFDGIHELPPLDDVWIVQSVSSKGVAEVKNTRTDHVAKLGADHIHHFDTDPQSEWDGLKHGFFWLNVQLSLNGMELLVEPIPPNKRKRL